MCLAEKKANQEPSFPNSSVKAKLDVLKGHPTDLESFWKAYPEFLCAPIATAGLLKGLTYVPAVREYMTEKQLSAFGGSSALGLVVFGLLLSYTMHAFIILHVPRSVKLQTHEYNKEPVSMAVRSTATILSNLIYAFYPVGATSTSWYAFAAWIIGTSICYDAWFFASHKYFHETPANYKFFHKLHHLVKVTV